MQSSLVTQLKAMAPQELGERVRAARVSRGLTQTQLGSPEVSAAYVSRIESGQRRLRPDLLTSFAERLAVPVERLLDQTDPVDPSEMVLELNYAELALESREFVEAEARSREALGRLPEDAGGQLGLLRARARFLHARALEATGQLEQAIVDLEQVRCAGGADLQWVRSRLALSRCYRETGDLTRAVECGRPALQLLEDFGLAHCDEAIQLVVTVAAAYYERGDTGEAKRLCQRAVERAEQAGSPTAKASAYWNASMIEAQQGSIGAAVSLAERALALLGEGNDVRNLARLRSELGAMQLMSDDTDVDEAARTLEQASAELRASSAGAVEVALNDLALGKVLLLRGDPDRVQAMTEQVLDSVGEVAPIVAAGAHVLSGRAWAARGDIAAAHQAFRRAVATLSSIGADRAAAELWFELGALWEGVGDAEASRDAYRSAGAASGLRLRFRTPATRGRLTAV